MMSLSSAIRPLAKLLACLGMVGCAARNDRAARPVAPSGAASISRPQAVLFIGNSYSFGVPRAFTRHAAWRGQRVATAQATHSGWSLARHAAHPATLREIRSRRWDIVVLQEHSLTPGHPGKRRRDMLPAVRRLAQEARAAGAVTVLYQTWGRRDGDPARPGDDFHAMNGRVRDGVLLTAAEAGGLTVVPVGDAWEREVAAGRAKRLFQADGSHPSAYGDRVTARTFYQAFFHGDGVSAPALGSDAMTRHPAP